MNIRYFISLLCVIAFILSSCNSNESIKPVEIMRFDVAINEYNEMSAEQRLQFRDSFSDVIELLSMVEQKKLDEDTLLSIYADSRPVKMFSQAVNQNLGSIDSVQSILGHIQNNIDKVLPMAFMGDIYSIVSSNVNTHIFMNDTVMLVALNHYLGSEFQGYSNFDTYLRRFKTLHYLPYDIAEARIAYAYPFQQNDDSKVINRMMYEGALSMALVQIVPDALLEDVIGCSTEELSWMQENEKNIWNTLISKELLYSTSLMDVSRLVNKSPSVPSIHPDCPGRVGRYIGYRIVESYINNNASTELTYLLSPRFYNSTQTLIASRYFPK